MARGEAAGGERGALLLDPAAEAVEKDRARGAEAVGVLLAEREQHRDRERGGAGPDLHQLEALRTAEQSPALGDLPRPEAAEERMHLG